MINDTLRAIAERRSIRRFTDKPLTDEQLDALIEAALQAPTAMNRQEWAFRFITDTNLIETLNTVAMETLRADGDQETIDRMAARHESIFYGAPLLVLISAPDQSNAWINCGIAVQTLALAAQSMGLGSCIIGIARACFSGVRGAEMARRVNFPAGHQFVISIAIGSPAISKEAHERRPEKVEVITSIGSSAMDG